MMKAHVLSGALLFATALGAAEPEVFVLFDRQPKTQGMSFVREGLAPSDQNIGGQAVWNVMQGSAPGMPWGRSVFFKIEDPRFKQGRMPAVDIEIVYKNNAQAPVIVKADTQRGPAEIGMSFGESQGLQTLNIRLDDAYFGNRPVNKPQPHDEPDGADLRITAFNNDFQIRSIRVKGHDLDRSPDFRRLVRIDEVATKPDGIFLFQPGEKRSIDVRILNVAKRVLPARWSAVLTDDQGKEISQSSGTTSISPSGRTTVSLPVDTTGKRFGVYGLEFKLWNASSREAEPIIDRRITFGVASGTTLPKAAPGEFLYGLDFRLGGAYHNPLLLRWADAMGVDIVRHGFDSEDNIEEVRRAMPVYEKERLQVMFICGPPWNPDPNARSEAVAHREKFLETLAGEFPKIRFYELGNEPDLTFFYGGPISDYYDAYVRFYDAIKRSNPETVVMNGGLSFFGTDGDRRSRELIRMTSPDKIDAIAYHGHGPGVTAERSALARVRAVAVESGKGDKPLVETESGLAAKTPTQQRSQARTAVQKMIFAQSEKMPLFMWFRLLMFEEDYGSLNAEREPRPVVLAYRAMVETLRGFRFSRLIDSGITDTEIYLFEKPGSSLRALVAWSNTPAAHDLYIAVAPNAEKVSEATLIDLFGNRSPAEVLTDGSLRVPISEDPVFLTWESAEPSFEVRRSPGLLDAGTSVQLLAGVTNSVPVKVRNPFDRELAVTVTAEPAADLGLAINEPRQAATLQAGETREIVFQAAVPAARQNVRWPETWTVFLDPDPATRVNAFQQIPETVPGLRGTKISPKVVFAEDGMIDFTKHGGLVNERSPAIAFAEIESDIDQTVSVAAGADWWMAWYLNGKLVFDTLAEGNQSTVKPTAHEFKMPLRRGKNLLAAKVLSGSGGFKLGFADPEHLARSKDASGARGIGFSLAGENKELGTARVPVTFIRPVTSVAAGAFHAPAADWERRKPTVLLNDQAIRNLHEKFPDSSRWWGGAEDLSAAVWLAADSARLYVIIRVTDDKLVEGRRDPMDGDAVVVGLSRQGGDDVNTYVIHPGSSAVTKVRSAFGLPAGELPVDNPEINAQFEQIESGFDEAPGALYRVSIDRKLLGDQAFFINLLVNDADANFRKQYLEWKRGLEGSESATDWYRTSF